MIDEFTLQITNYSWNDNERILKIGLLVIDSTPSVLPKLASNVRTTFLI